MIEIYGAPLYRVPVDFGFGCPHRNSNAGSGCTFCPDDGSRAQYTKSARTLEEQVRIGLSFARSRYKAKRFMAYVQAFTGTNAPVSEQRRCYDRLLALYPFEAVTIGTRPDCVPGPTVDLLKELAGRTDVWVELGVQTVHDRTLVRVNRGHDWETTREAILRLSEAGLHVAAHVILGLPGEKRKDFWKTAETLAKLPIEGIKIHNLHVVRGTPLADEFQDQPFPIYDEYRYSEILIDFLRRLPSRIAIMRINTDTPDEDLVAPRWKMKKGQFASYVREEMLRRGVCQGDLCSGKG